MKRKYGKFRPPVTALGCWEALLRLRDLDNLRLLRVVEQIERWREREREREREKERERDRER